jgi:hypothetical protein
MIFVAPKTKQARLWVDAVSKSLQIDKSKAATMYANLCGFTSWDRVVEAIGRAKPSMTDEKVSQDILDTRKEFYCEVLVNNFGMNETLAEYMINRASPSSEQKPKRFSINTDALFEQGDDEEGINLHHVFKSLGLDTEKGVDEAAEKLLGDVMPEGFSFENFANRMRISKPLDPGAWFDMLASIGWDLVEDSFREDYVYGEESFFAVKDGVKIPVFITSLTRVPHDTDDDMANHVMALVEEFATEDLESDEIILFWGQPSFKKIGGKDYSHFGMYYTDGQWHEFLLNRETSIHNVFNQHRRMDSVDAPPADLSDERMMLTVAAVRIMNGIGDNEKVSYLTAENKSGWNLLMPTPAG